LDGKVVLAASPFAGREIDRHFKFEGKSIIISKNAYAAGMDDNYASKEN
jgi:hypothetical protein